MGYGKRLRQLYEVGFNVASRSLTPRYLPSHVQIEITTFCNMDCLSCGRRHIVDKGRHMPFEAFRHIYDQIRPVNINLSGLGEPLLHPDLFEIIRYCKHHGSVVNFPTNLSLPHSGVLENLVRSGVDQIKVSIDAASAAAYQAVRGQDKFDQVVENVRTLSRLKEEIGSCHPEVRFNYCLQKTNLEELPRLISLARELSIDAIYIQDLNYFSVEDEKSRLCGFSAQHLARILDDAYRLSRELRVATNILNWKRNFKWLYNKTLPRKDYEANSIRCSFPWISTFIDVNGGVKPCPVFVWDADAESLGNCLDERFVDIWRSERYRALRRDFRRNCRRMPICRRCVPPRLLDIQLIFTKMLAWRS